jgi:tetratricopeptide (TPR) repeat protein
MATLDEEVLQANMNGITLAKQGRLDDAAEWFRHALQLKPDSPMSHNNLGNILTFQGNFVDAVACYRASLHLKPNDPAAWNNLGHGLRQLGEVDEAVAACRHALALCGDYAEAHNNLGIALEAKDELQDALFHCQQAVQLKPDLAEAYNNLSIILRRLRRLDEATAAANEALRLRPDFAEAENNRGMALAEAKRWTDAESCYRRALQLRPMLAEAHLNLANCVFQMDRLDEAASHCGEALRLNPKSADAYTTHGAMLLRQGRFDEALAKFDEAVRLKPDHATAHFNRSMVLLLRGDFAGGWPEYKWRWKCREFVLEPFSRAFWDGGDIAGKTVLLHTEQGLGDTMQFIRYAPLVKRRGAKVIVAVPSALLPLLRPCKGIDELVVREGEMPVSDADAPLLDLPAMFGTRLENIPADVPYLFADERLVARWREELSSIRDFKVGIAWQGSTKNPVDRLRSISLEQFAPLAQPGVQLISLQKGPGIEQLERVRFPVMELGSRLDEKSGPFMDTAAVMKNLDLVITTDTAIVHLAGAMGVPVWVALPLVPDWRWLLGRDDSPWYPTVRLFRQTAAGKWDDVFERIAVELRGRVGAPRGLATIAVPVSPGELIDKITILEIKRERIADAKKVKNVTAELELLTAARDRGVPPSSELMQLTADLRRVNEALWDIEDAIRVCEHERDFGSLFIELARSVYHQNDRRAALKRSVNELLGSKLVEEKSYK